MKKYSIFCLKPWTNNFEKFDFFDFFKTSLFWCKKYSFLPRTSKSKLFWLNLPKKYLKKNQFFDKNHALTPLENLDILEFLKLHFPGLKSILFYPEHKKHNLSKKYP